MPQNNGEYTKLHGITSHKTAVFIDIAIKTASTRLEVCLTLKVMYANITVGFVLNTF